MSAEAFRLRNGVRIVIKDQGKLHEWISAAKSVAGKGTGGDSPKFRAWLMAKAAEMSARSMIPADWAPGGGIVSKAELYEALAKSVTDRGMQDGYRELAETARAHTVVIQDRDPGGQRLKIEGRFDVVRAVPPTQLASRGELLGKALDCDKWAGRAADGETARLYRARARQLRTEAAAS